MGMYDTVYVELDCPFWGRQYRYSPMSWADAEREVKGHKQWRIESGQRLLRGEKTLYLQDFWAKRDGFDDIDAWIAQLDTPDKIEAHRTQRSLGLAQIQTKEFENLLEEFYVGDEVPKYSGHYFIPEDFKCEQCSTADENVYVKVWLEIEGRKLKAARLKRIKPGYFNPPTGRPIFVPGFNWLQILVTGLKGTPTLAHLCWWTTRGEKASGRREEEGKILNKVAKLWGRKVIHIWDRGFAGSPWTSLALDHHLRFILRWNKSYHVIGPDGRKQEVWKITRGKRSWEHRLLWDTHRRCERMTGVSRCRCACPTMSVHSSWWFHDPALGASLGICSPPNELKMFNKPGRLFLLMPGAGKSKCRCALPNPSWLLNPRDCSIGKHA